MKLSLRTPPPLADKAEEKEQNLYQWYASLLAAFLRVVDGASLGFGDGLVTDNIAGEWFNYTTNAVANTEDAIAHNLGVIPIGWITVSCDKAGVLYKGSSTWTTSSMFLKCNVASVTVRIFILTASN